MIANPLATRRGDYALLKNKCGVFVVSRENANPLCRKAEGIFQVLCQ